MRLKVRFFARSIQAAFLFFCLSASLSAASPPLPAPARPYFRFETAERQIYWQLLNFRFAAARSAVKRIPADNLIRIYLENWADVLEIIGNLDKKLYESKVPLREERLRQIARSDKNSPYHLFLQAEIRLQWALAQAVFEEPLSAALNIRKAFQLLHANAALYPGFEGNRKSLGVLQVVLGSVPPQYEWLLSLWGLSGDAAKGFRLLSEVAAGNSPYAPEARIWLLLLKSRNGEEPPPIPADTYPGKWLWAVAFRKAGNGEKALQLFSDLPADAPSLLCLEKATALLNSGNCEEALRWLDLFEDKHRGEDLLKDAQLKRFWCFWLQNREPEARAALQKLKNTGRTRTEADKNAAYFAALNPLPDKRLVKARLLTDGGYTEASDKILQTVDLRLLNQSDRCEYRYRLARNAHRAGKLAEALLHYEACLQQAADAEFYFLANAALQAGIICRDYRQDKEKARRYFFQAMKYQRHPYKKSIDRKAKEALASLD